MAQVQEIEPNVAGVSKTETEEVTGGEEEMSQTAGTSTDAACDETNVTIKRSPSKLKDKEKKLGHRRVDQQGQVTYKRKPTSELMATIQLGIGQSIGSLSSKPERDLLMHDFHVVESVFFPSEGSNMTQAHHCADFRFKTYAPIAFRYFRELFGIKPEDFLMSLCDEPLEELSNPGASGSIFYRTNDDEFIIKTVQHKEADFLQKLLPGYYMNLNQNPRTLLPKFYGLYCYQHGGKNIRFIIMNNLLPSSIRMHEKYDLKGSSYKRRANKSELRKKSPTLKDLDFPDQQPEGLLLESETYRALIQTIHRDCMVLESFKIMDYSLLLGVYNLDQARRDRETASSQPPREELPYETGTLAVAASSSYAAAAAVVRGAGDTSALNRVKSMRQRLAQYSTAIESIQAHHTQPVDVDEDHQAPTGGIPSRNSKGDRLLLFIGIIDILQSYRLKKKMEHTFKAMITDGDTVSVHRPSFYSQRFQDFLAQRVFHRIPSSSKSSPSKRKSNKRLSSTDNPYDEKGAVGGQPDLLQSASKPRDTPDSPSHDPSHLPTDAAARDVKTIEHRSGATTQAPIQLSSAPIELSTEQTEEVEMNVRTKRELPPISSDTTQHDSTNTE